VIGSGFHHNLTNDTIASVEDVIESLFYEAVLVKGR
jgi:hypothetical protein